FGNKFVCAASQSFLEQRMKDYVQQLLVVLCALAFLAPAAFGQEVLWRTHFEAGEAAQKKGSYAEAETHFTSALKSAEAFGGTDGRLISTIRKLAGLYDDQGKYEDAERLYERLIAADEKATGKDNPQIATDLSDLATVYRHQGRYAEAEALYQRALSMMET